MLIPVVFSIRSGICFTSYTICLSRKASVDTCYLLLLCPSLPSCSLIQVVYFNPQFISEKIN